MERCASSHGRRTLVLPTRGKMISQGWDPRFARNLVRAGITKVGVFLTGFGKRPTLAHRAPASCFKQAGSCCSNGDAQNPCGFGCVEILDVSQEKRFPIFTERASIARCSVSPNFFLRSASQAISCQSVKSFAIFSDRDLRRASAWSQAQRRPFQNGRRNRKCFCAHAC